MVTANNNSCLNALHLCLFCIATLYKDAATATANGANDGDEDD